MDLATSFRRASSPQDSVHSSYQCIVDQHALEGIGNEPKYNDHHGRDRAEREDISRASSPDEQLIVEHSRARKRRRTSRSINSDPRPALNIQSNVNLTAAEGSQQGHGTESWHYERFVDGGNAPSDVSNRTALLDAPKQVAVNYERRKRHKTRESRYDIKQGVAGQVHTATQSRRGNRSAKTKGRKVKSGNALMQDFAAPNVPTDRLTV